MSYDLKMLNKYSRPSYMKHYYEVIVPTVEKLEEVLCQEKESRE